MANWFSETIRPRMRKGVISAMYMGEVIEAAPMPIPPMKRNTMNSARVRGRAVPTAETKNARAAEDQHLLAAETVAEESGRSRPERTAGQGAGGGKALPKRRQLEADPQEADGPGDNRRIVAEQQPAQGRHRPSTGRHNAVLPPRSWLVSIVKQPHG